MFEITKQASGDLLRRPNMSMTFDGIESVLGSEVVANIEAAIIKSFAAAEQTHNGALARAAIIELLVSYLAAAIITPAEGAGERTRDAVALLHALVDTSLTLKAQPSGRC